MLVCFILYSAWSATKEVHKIGQDSLNLGKKQKLEILNEFFSSPPEDKNFYIKVEDVFIYPADFMFCEENKAYWSDFKKKLSSKQLENLYLQRTYHLRDERFIDFFLQLKGKKLSKVKLYSVPDKGISNIKKYMEEMEKYLNYQSIGHWEPIIEFKNLKEDPKSYFIDDDLDRLKGKKGVAVSREKLDFGYVLTKKHLNYQKSMFLNKGIWVSDHEVINFFDKKGNK